MKQFKVHMYFNFPGHDAVQPVKNWFLKNVDIFTWLISR